MTNRKPISRRDLLLGRLFKLPDDSPSEAVGSDSLGSPPHTSPRNPDKLLPVLRPPGAIDEPAFLEGCTRCNDCAKVCPVDAIFPAPAIMGAIRDTPMIDPMSAACVMCEDMPCIAACEPKVLRAEAGLKMGVAKIKPMNCLAFGGTICTVCSERCPVEGAITIVQGRPIIEEDICTGCGTCQYVCPAPYNAIAIMPDEARYLDAPGNIPEETASWRKQLFANKSLRPEDNISDADFSE